MPLSDCNLIIELRRRSVKGHEMSIFRYFSLFSITIPSVTAY